MKGELEVRVIPQKLPLTPAAIRAMQRLDRYDAVLFTSRNARKFFMQELPRRSALPHRVIQVGPRGNLLRYDLRGQRLLFPRSALAPSDIVRTLRAQGATVHVILLYTVRPERLTPSQKVRLLKGEIRQLYFKSPSGIRGFLGQFRGRDRSAILSIPARCIGETTASAARKSGFKRVFIR